MTLSDLAMRTGHVLSPCQLHSLKRNDGRLTVIGRSRAGLRVGVLSRRRETDAVVVTGTQVLRFGDPETSQGLEESVETRGEVRGKRRGDRTEDAVYRRVVGDLDRLVVRLDALRGVVLLRLHTTVAKTVSAQSIRELQPSSPF